MSSTEVELHTNGGATKDADMDASKHDELFTFLAASHKISLEWRAIELRVRTSKTETKTILSGCHGVCPESCFTAIIGSSGAGKSSLLNVLAGRIGSAMSWSGQLLVNKAPMSPLDFREQIAYSMQEDALCATATPREALNFSANLRCHEMPAADRRTMCERLLVALGLSECADRYVGNELMRGISGGQKKRCAVGVELVSQPTMLFADEPTSGLDAYTAHSLITLLRDLSRGGCATMATIHQPSSEVFSIFDNVTVVHAGRILFTGPRAGLAAHFVDRALPCPEYYNVADHVMFVVSSQPQAVVDGLFVEAPAAAGDALVKGAAGSGAPAVPRASFLAECRELVIREAHATRRDTGALIGRFGITIFLNLFFMVIFLGVGNGDMGDAADLQSAVGAVVNLAISGMFGASQGVILLFPFERPIFIREYATGTYGIVSYFWSKFVLEGPLSMLQSLVILCCTYWGMNLQGSFLIHTLGIFMLSMVANSMACMAGAAAASAKDAAESIPLLFVPQIIFSGFFIRMSQIPVFIRWAQYLCGLKYAVNILVCNELKQCSEDGYQPCIDYLRDNDMNVDHIPRYFAVMVGMFVLFRAISLWLLKRKAAAFD